jgi:hypothetical protein
MRMPMKDTDPTFVVPGVIVVSLVARVLPVPIPDVWLGTLEFEHALNRQITIMVRSIPNQVTGGCFLDIVIIKFPFLLAFLKEITSSICQLACVSNTRINIHNYKALK